MNMRNVTCVGTQTSKVPTSVALLFISYSMYINHKDDKTIGRFLLRTSGYDVNVQDQGKLLITPINIS